MKLEPSINPLWEMGGSTTSTDEHQVKARQIHGTKTYIFPPQKFGVTIMRWRQLPQHRSAVNLNE
jgi:hypothetical protein